MAIVDIKSGKEITRGGFLKGVLASGIAPWLSLGSVGLAGAANASVGGMMRNVGARCAAMFSKPYDREVSFLRCNSSPGNMSYNPPLFINTGIVANGSVEVSADVGYGTYSTAEIGMSLIGSNDIISKSVVRNSFITRLWSRKYTEDLSFECRYRSYYYGVGITWANENVMNHYVETHNIDGSYSLSVNGRNSIIGSGVTPITNFIGPLVIGGEWHWYYKYAIYPCGGGIRFNNIKIKVDGILRRDFIAVAKNGKGCLFDRCESKVYLNEGTENLDYE